MPYLVVICDATGKTILSQSNSQMPKTTVVLNINSGIYFK